jgi:hypothetical protein
MPFVDDRDTCPAHWPENFVLGVYAALDAAAGRELNRLALEEGLSPSCHRGCGHCCGQHILTSIAEAQALAAFVRREFSPSGLHDLRRRTREWHAWDRCREGSGVQSPDCPLLVAGACSAYPMRPVICRSHFVTSAPHLCGPQTLPGGQRRDPVAMASVWQATRPFARLLQERVEEAGMDFQRTTMPLPHWLAQEMEWDCTPVP